MNFGLRFFLLAVAVTAGKGTLADTDSQKEQSLPMPRRTEEKNDGKEGCTSTMDSKTGTPTCWVNHNGWKSCKDVDANACTTVCQNSAMLSSKCTDSGGKDGGGKDGGDKDGGDKDGWEKDGGKTPTASSSFEHTWKSATKTRTYSMVKPSAAQPVGMVVVLQPSGGSCGGLSSLAQSNSLVVVCPFSSGSAWKSLHPEDSEDVDFIAKLITSLTASEGVPAGKVIVTGFSWGGTMAFRVLCERSDVLGGIVPMGQSFFEPAGGHVPKGSERSDMTTTQQALQIMNTVRNGADKCVPTPSRPHFALVGTQDNFYGEAAGAYKGKALWEFYSTTVTGCSGPVSSSSAAESQAITGKAGSTCYHYSSCPGLSKGSLNQYCTVSGFGHETTGWEGLVASAFANFFGAGTSSASSASLSSGTTHAMLSSLAFALTTVAYVGA